MALGGDGSFDALLGGLGISVAGTLPAVVWTYMLAWLSAQLFFYSITIHHTQGLSRLGSALVALVSFLGSFAVWITIVR